MRSVFAAMADRLMVNFKYGILSAAGLLVFAVSAPTLAATMTIENSTWAESYNGTSAYPFFSGSNWGASVGAPTYETTQLIVSTPAANTIDFQFTTGFNGNDTTYDTPAYGNVVVRYADIFLNPVLSAAPPSSYGYAIVLGDETANGGLSKPGLYQVTSYETSQDIWGSRNQFVYGGEYAPTNATDSGPNLSEAQAAPTVVTGGILLSDWTVSDSYANGILDVELSTSDTALFDQLTSNYDLFWGTGDCDNAPFFAAVDAPVPEPGSLLLLATALGGLSLVRLRQRAGS
jgi:hypothetical protein